MSKVEEINLHNNVACTNCTVSSELSWVLAVVCLWFETY